MLKYNLSRNTARNSATGLITRILELAGGFVVKTLLIRILGIEYFGLDGLFTSILTLLNMAELGFNAAIVYKFYEPIARGEKNKVCALLNFYRKIYRVVGLIVLSVGLCIIPFLPSLVDVSRLPDSLNLVVLYLIYLSGTVSSYWLYAHKTALLTAYQRNDLISKVTNVVLIGKYVLQILLLVVFRSYYLFIIFVPFSTIIVNIGVCYLSNRYYSELQCYGDIDITEKRDIWQKIKALLYNKIGVAIIGGSANLIISKYLGLFVLGIYQSYYFVFSFLYSLFNVIHNSITAGIGNRIITETKEENYNLFLKICFLNSLLVGFASITLCCLYTPFIKIWIGDSDAMPPLFPVAMSIYFYLWLIRFGLLIYKNAQGLWWPDRFRPFVEALINIMIAMSLIHHIGLYSIIIANVVAMAVSIPWETSVVFNFYFQRSPFKYYLMMIKMMIVNILVGCFCYILCMLVPVSIFGLFVKLAICTITILAIYYAVYRKSKYSDLVYGYWKRFKNKYNQKIQ